jgi:carbonic anhydrase
MEWVRIIEYPVVVVGTDKDIIAGHIRCGMSGGNPGDGTQCGNCRDTPQITLLFHSHTYRSLVRVLNLSGFTSIEPVVDLA